MAEDDEQRFYFPQVQYPFFPGLNQPPSINYPFTQNISNTQDTNFKFKYSRVWDKKKIQKLYSLATDYSKLLGKPIEYLDINDYAEISTQISQDPYKCMMKMREVIISGTLKPGIWSKIEDEKLKSLMISGKKKWGEIANILNTEIHQNLKIRSGKQAKERWNNHLNPDIDRGPWTSEQDIILLQAYKQFGNKWTQICKTMPNRTESAVKNRVKSLLNKAKQDLKTLDKSENVLDMLLVKSELSVSNASCGTIELFNGALQKITDKNN